MEKRARGRPKKLDENGNPIRTAKPPSEDGVKRSRGRPRKEGGMTSQDAVS